MSLISIERVKKPRSMERRIFFSSVHFVSFFALSEPLPLALHPGGLSLYFSSGSLSPANAFHLRSKERGEQKRVPHTDEETKERRERSRKDASSIDPDDLDLLSPKPTSTAAKARHRHRRPLHLADHPRPQRRRRRFLFRRVAGVAGRVRGSSFRDTFILPFFFLMKDMT